VLTATSAKALSESTRHFGFSILDLKICEEDFKGSAFMGLSPAFNQNLESKMLLDYFIRPRQNIGRDR